MILPLACLLVVWFLVSRSPVRARLLATLNKAGRNNQIIQRAGAGCLVLSAVAVLLRGRPDVSVFLLGSGLWLFTRARSSARAAAAPNKVPSRVRSAMIEMEFDPTVGAMRGMVLAGPDEGRVLDILPWSRCEAVYALCLKADTQGARLLEAYFDRRFAGWRQAGQGDQDARRGDNDARRDRARHPNRMSEQEAHEVLGLSREASRDDIVRTHRALMKKLHPDQGGSTDLAARVNEAKEILMRRHL